MLQQHMQSLAPVNVFLVNPGGEFIHILIEFIKRYTAKHVISIMEDLYYYLNQVIGTLHHIIVACGLLRLTQCMFMLCSPIRSGPIGERFITIWENVREFEIGTRNDLAGQINDLAIGE